MDGIAGIIVVWAIIIVFALALAWALSKEGQ
jgi:hypothetical protein